MVKSQCCEKGGLKKGPWTPEEDQKLLAYIEEHGHGSWRALPAKAGLQRCGKSCRLRWTNYLRPDIKRGKFSLQEEQTIIQLHAFLGNRWSAIATHLPKRTDNEIKNYWNTHLKKRLDKMGIDPVTHKPKADSFGSGSSHSKGAANLTHMAQWESARLEAEARLVRESKLLPSNISANNGNNIPSQNQQVIGLANKAAAPPPRPQCLDVLKAWQGVVFSMFAVGGGGSVDSLESPTSTLNFSENAIPIPLFQKNPTSTTVAVPTCNNGSGSGPTSATTAKADHHHHQLDNGNHFECFGKLNETPSQVNRDSMGGGASHEMISSMYSGENNAWFFESFRAAGNENMMMAGLSDMLVCSDHQDHNALSSVIAGSSCGGGNPDENRNYWNSLLNLVDDSPTGSPVF